MKQGKCLKFIQLAAALLMVSQWMGAAPAQAASVQVNPTIRVRLFYGGSALPGANLLNEVGSGYRFGYFDGSLRFVPLGSTAKTAISMVKDQTVYYGTVGGWAGGRLFKGVRLPWLKRGFGALLIWGGLRCLL